MKRFREYNSVQRGVAYPISSPANTIRHSIPLPFFGLSKELVKFSFSRKTVFRKISHPSLSQAKDVSLVSLSQQITFTV